MFTRGEIVASNMVSLKTPPQVYAKGMPWGNILDLELDIPNIKIDAIDIIKIDAIDRGKVLCRLFTTSLY